MEEHTLYYHDGGFIKESVDKINVLERQRPGFSNEFDKILDKNPLVSGDNSYEIMGINIKIIVTRTVQDPILINAHYSIGNVIKYTYRDGEKASNIPKSIDEIIVNYFQNFTPGFNVKTIFFYPSAYNKKYEVILTYDKDLSDYTRKLKLKKYKDSLVDEGETKLAEGVDKYLEKRDLYIKNNTKYVLIDYSGNISEYSVEPSDEDGGGILLEVGKEYNKSGTFYYSTGRYFKFNVVSSRI